MKTLLIIYWITTTICGVYWLIKNPNRNEDPKEFSLFEIIAKIFPSMIAAPFLVPIYLLSLIKFKR